MPVTIERRIRRTVLSAILMTFFLTVAAVMVANESLERSLLEMDVQAERELVLQHLRSSEILVWDSAAFKAYYVPPDVAPDDQLPPIFHGFPIPFSGELEIGDATFLITTGFVRGGRFYLAKDISLFESREAAFHRFLFFLGLAAILFGIMLARVTGRRLAVPIQQLTSQIRGTAPAPRMPRVDANYKDAELKAIAQSFNMFLGEFETYVKREQSLMGLASHELRTPIAVIAGALDVIEQRGGIKAAEKGPFIRMRRAVDEMAANIDVILKLTRRKSLVERREPVGLVDLMNEVKDDLIRHTPSAADRVRVTVVDWPRVNEDPALIKMLLRNLVQNAVQHTAGSVNVQITRWAIEIGDEGTGLPKAYLAYLNDPQADVGELLSLSGLGLFIVTLICERLSWALQVVPSEQPGTTVRISLSPVSNVATNEMD
ncbi:MAG TPA: HAMP domain-containing sensor histidine kinase [Rhodocyclaceae bacterium]|mgnify:CR=1 FL=1|nr:HAMP domain-containing sensor histidine kinase [Rhodocyclaceae bacterium]